MEHLTASDSSQISKRRFGIIYMDRVKLHRKDNSLEVILAAGRTYIPLNDIAAIMLGPGTSISDKAIQLIGEMGITIIWVGQDGVRYYASGEPLTKKDHFLKQQAVMSTNKELRLKVAKQMYQMRFQDEIVTDLSLSQLRGKEGFRVKETYRRLAEEYNVTWSSRINQISKMAENDNINQAITMATSSLYGVVHAATVAIGCSPGLGFIHTGIRNAFICDIADLYKMSIAAPVAFEIVSRKGGIDSTIDQAIRERMREEIRNRKLIKQIIEDIKMLLEIKTPLEDIDEIYLWDINDTMIKGGINYGGITITSQEASI